MAKAIPTLADFEKLALKSTGLVPMTHTLNLIDVKRGETRGYAPDMALRLFTAGQAVPFEKNGQLPESDGVGDRAVRDARDTVAPGTNGITAGGAAAALTQRPAGTAPGSAAGTGGSDTDIPADWREQSGLVLARIAKRISGRTDSMTKEQASEIIEAEVNRRAGNGSGSTGTGGQGSESQPGAGGDDTAGGGQQA